MTIVRERNLRSKVANQLNPAKMSSGLSPINKIIVGVIIICIIVSIFATEPYIINNYYDTILWLEIVFLVFFSVEYVARIWAAPEDDNSISATKNRVKFMLSFSGIVDFFVLMIMLLPFIFESTVILRLLRIFRILSLAKLGRFTGAWTLIRDVVKDRGYELIIAVLLTFGLMVISATVLYYTEGEIQPDNFGSIPRALWWSVITLTTVGYGDASPVTFMGKLMASGVALMGIALVALPSGILAAGISDALQKKRDEDNK